MCRVRTVAVLEVRDVAFLDRVRCHARNFPRQY
jgi:hypothetical protein